MVCMTRWNADHKPVPGGVSLGRGIRSGSFGLNEGSRSVPAGRRAVSRTVAETRIAGIDWLNDALCSLYDDDASWLIDPSTYEDDDAGVPQPEGPALTVADLRRLDAARATCACCPERCRCLELAAETETVPSGIWGGLDWEQRDGHTLTEADRKARARAKETPAQRADRLRKDREAKRAKRAKS